MIEKTKAAIRAILPKNAFVRGVSVLVGGTSGAQLLLVLAAPLLTRLYSPEDFGLLAVYASLLSLLGVISSLRYELAISLPEDDGEAANVAALSLILVGISTLLTGMLVFFVSQPIADLLGTPALADYLWLLPAGVFLGGGYQIFNYWAVRTKRFSTIAGTKLWQALAVITIQLAVSKLGGIALLLGHVAGQSVGIASLGRPTLSSTGFRQVSWQGIFSAATRYRRFPMLSTWSSLLNSGGTQLPPLIFAGLFGPAATGLYSIAHRILALPISLVGQAVSQVFLSNGSDAKREGRLGLQVDKVLALLINVAMPPIVIIVIFGPELFEFIFGADWRTSGDLARWMAIWLFFQFCVSPLPVFIILERQDLSLLMEISLFVMRFVAIVFGFFAGDLKVTLIYFSLASALGYAIFLGVKIAISGASIIFAARNALTSLVMTLILVAPLVLGARIEEIGLYRIIFVLMSSLLLVIFYYRLVTKLRIL